MKSYQVTEAEMAQAAAARVERLAAVAAREEVKRSAEKRSRKQRVEVGASQLFQVNVCGLKGWHDHHAQFNTAPEAGKYLGLIMASGLFLRGEVVTLTATARQSTAPPATSR